MLRINFKVLGLILWMSILFNIERLDVNRLTAANIGIPIYIAAILVIVLGLLLPQYIKTKSWHLFLVCTILFLIAKNLTSQPIFGNGSTYLSAFELGALFISAMLAHSLGRSTSDLVDTARALIFADLSGHVYTPAEADFRIKQEMQYARRADEPLSIVVIEAKPEDAEINLHATAIEIQNLIVKRYSTAALTRLLAWKSRRTDFFLDQRDSGHLVLVAPRAGKDQIPTIIGRLTRQAKDSLGISLNLGIATFPEQGITFEELVYQAEQDLKDQATAVHNRGQILPLKASHSKSGIRAQNGNKTPEADSYVTQSTN